MSELCAPIEESSLMRRSKLIFSLRLVAVLPTVLYCFFFDPLTSIPDYLDIETREMNEDHLLCGLSYFIGACLCVFLLVSTILSLLTDNIILRTVNILISSYYYGFLFYANYMYSGPGIHPPKAVMFAAFTFLCVTLFCNFLRMYAFRDRIKWKRIWLTSSIVLSALITFLVLMIPARASEEWRKLMTSVEELYEEGNYEEALVIAQEALRVADLEVGSEHLAYGISLRHMAQVYLRMQMYDESESLYKRALTLFESTHGLADFEVALILRQLGKVAICKKQFDDSELYFQRSFTIIEDLCGPNSFQVGVSLLNFGVLYLHSGDYDKAVGFLERTVVFAKRFDGLKNFTTADCMFHLALAYDKLNKIEQAKDCYRLAFDLYKDDLGMKHSKVVECLLALGELCYNNDVYKSAEMYLKQCLTISELYGHEEVLRKSLDLLVEVYRALLQFSDAAEMQQRIDALDDIDQESDLKLDAKSDFDTGSRVMNDFP